MKTAYAKIELLIFLKPGSNRQQKCNRSYIYFMVKAPTTSSEHIYNSSERNFILPCKAYKIFELGIFSYK